MPVQISQMRPLTTPVNSALGAMDAVAGIGLKNAQIPYINSQTAMNNASIPYIPMKYEAAMLNGSGRMLGSVNGLANSYRYYTQTPEGQAILKNNPQLAASLQNIMQQQSDMMNRGGYNMTAMGMLQGGVPTQQPNPGIAPMPNRPAPMGNPMGTPNRAPLDSMPAPVMPPVTPTQQQGAAKAAISTGVITPDQINKLGGLFGSSPNAAPSNATQDIQNVASDQLLKTTGIAYKSLPKDQQEAQVAQLAGMGVDPATAARDLMSGKTVPDIAKAQGFDPSNMPDPIYPTTKSSLTRIQARQQALKEIDTLNPILTAATAPYARRVDGYSPKQIAQAISGDNPDQQAKFLAARALTPEMSSLRLKAMGGNVGIEAIREVTNGSMGKLKSFQSLVSPDVYTKANQYMDQWIRQGSTAANSTGLRSFGNTQSAQAPASSAASPITKNIGGQTYTQINGKWYAQ